MNIEKLESVRVKIENMPIFHQIEVLKILNNYKEEITINENSNGVFVNLTDLSNNIVDELDNYITYVEHQEKNINYFEEQQENFKTNYFEKNIKDNEVITVNEQSC
jgi:flagellar biosynthesis chaperone FliJ